MRRKCEAEVTMKTEFLIIPNHNMFSCALTLIARVLDLLLVFTPLIQLI